MPDGTLARVDAPLLLRATFAPDTWNAEARTVEVVWTTGAPVERMDWMTGARFVEVLEVSPDAIDLSRLQAGAPVLDSHATWSLGDVVGVVEAAQVVGGEGRATLRFSERQEVAGIVQDVAGGIIRNISVGYRVQTWEVSKATATAAEIRTAKRWTPYELSLVAVGADPGAQVRADVPIPSSPPPAARAATQEPDMPETVVQTAPAQADANAIIAAERQRTADLMTIGRQAAMDPDWVQRHIAEGTSTDLARAQALEAVSARATQRVPAEVAGARQDENETNARLMQNALMHRAAAPGIVLEDGARQFRGFNLSDFARHCLEANGVNVRGMTKAEIAQAALTRSYRRDAPGMTSSDFPNLLANTASKMLRMSYEYAPRTFLPWTRQSNLPDFKTFKTIALSGAPQLAAVPESGEVSYGTLGEGAESWNLTRYGKAVTISYVAIVNDDMSGFTRVPQMFGAEAAQLENATVYGILTANAALADTGALFNATATTTAGGHANLTSGGGSALSNGDSGLAAVGALQTKIRLQKAPTVATVAGRPLNLSGRYLILPAALEYVALALFSQSVVPATTAQANPYRGVYEPIVEPVLDANSSTAFYLIAAPDRVDTVHYGRLDGEDGPVITSNVDFDTDGVAIKCMHNFGAKAIDFRGMAKSAGA